MKSYPKVYGLSHQSVKELLKGDMVVQEKVDGSQISFGVYPTNYLDGEMEQEYELRIKSKNKMIDLKDPGMFGLAVEALTAIEQVLTPCWTYCGEYIAKPKHNTLTYGCVPPRNVIIYDIDMGDEDFLDFGAVRQETDRLNMACVPTLGVLPPGAIKAEWLEAWMDRESVLGGCKIEGIVIKGYGRYGRDGKTMMAKIVSQEFKERNSANWKAANPTKNDVIELLKQEYATEARWLKSIQAARDDGTLNDNTTDIGPLIRRIQDDILLECGDEIKERLFKQAWPQIRRGLAAGFPEWYKARLKQDTFDQAAEFAAAMAADTIRRAQ